MPVMRHHAAAWLRFPAWGCVIALAVLSLLPAPDMIRTDAGGHIEHIVAYTGTAVLVAWGYPAAGWQRIVLPLVIYAGILELLQNFSPGRHPAILDWLSSSTGALIGTTLGRLTWRLAQVGLRPRHRP
jgi:VanZ family protein